jgi:hypothetical protein
MAAKERMVQLDSDLQGSHTEEEWEQIVEASIRKAELEMIERCIEILDAWSDNLPPAAERAPSWLLEDLKD